MKKLLICIVFGILLYLIPHELDYKAWGLFSIFASTILGIILRPYPMGVVALFGLLACILTGILDIKTQALNGFSSHIIWLVVMVFFLSRGVIKTHLGLRLACHFIKKTGRNPLTLGYGITLSELIISPLIPSNTARAGGIMLPIVSSICEALGSTPSRRRSIGGYLMQVGFHANTITSAIFLTSCAVNPVAQQFAFDQFGICITWLTWFKAAVVPGMISLLIMPLFLYFATTLEEKDLSASKTFADDRLRELGSIKPQEIGMIFIFALMLVLWVLEPYTKIQATIVAMIGVSLSFIFGILNLDDILAEREAWHILIWLSVLVTMSNHLQIYGFIPWFSSNIAAITHGLTGISALIVLSLIYFYSHYLFAGNTSQITAMYPSFIGVAVASGAPVLLTALVFGFFSSLYSSMTHYGSAAGTMFYSQKYVHLKHWWLNGFIMGLINVVVWLGVGMIWWKFIGII